MRMVVHCNIPVAAAFNPLQLKAVYLRMTLAAAIRMSVAVTDVNGHKVMLVVEQKTYTKETLRLMVNNNR